MPESSPAVNGHAAEAGYLQAAAAPPADRAEAARALIRAFAPAPGARHRGPHGEAVEVVVAGLIEADLAPAVLYRYAQSGRRFLAPLAAFVGEGARFRPAPTDPAFPDPAGPAPAPLRHYKGGRYDFLARGWPGADLLALGAAPGPWVAYRGASGVWFRPLADFEARVAWPDGVTRPRFVAADPQTEA